jgi:RiboL-PSP-HEPN
MDMRRHTLDEFTSNIDRVKNLVAVYRKNRPAGKGRTSVEDTDVLRAAVVFLHSSIEEVVRNLIIWKLPVVGTEEALDKIPLLGLAPNARPEKFFLGKLARYKGRFVVNLIRESIEAYVDVLNVNNVRDLNEYLTMISVDASSLRHHFSELEKVFRRRHQIVHQADRNSETGSGQHLAESLSIATVEGWVSSVQTFVDELIALVPENPSSDVLDMESGS